MCMKICIRKHGQMKIWVAKHFELCFSNKFRANLNLMIKRHFARFHWYNFIQLHEISQIELFVSKYRMIFISSVKWIFRWEKINFNEFNSLRNTLRDQEFLREVKEAEDARRWKNICWRKSLFEFHNFFLPSTSSWECIFRLHELSKSLDAEK
jgi:hypothetical protein